MSRKFAISDIHGCAKTFFALLEKIAFSQGDELYLLGDYLDRGPDSKGVFDAILGLQHEGYTVKGLMGNHEQMFLDALARPSREGFWLENGGRAALKSFGAWEVADVPQAYVDFMRGLHRFLEVDEFILVHAGLNFMHEDPFFDLNAMLWVRYWQPQIRYDWLGERIILHGHTPTERAEVEAQFTYLPKEKWLNIDGGCVFATAQTTSETYGWLTAFDMTNRALHFQKNVEAR